MSVFSKVIDKYRKYAFSEKDKGEKFERLMQAFLLTDPRYVTKFQSSLDVGRLWGKRHQKNKTKSFGIHTDCEGPLCKKIALSRYIF